MVILFEGKRVAHPFVEIVWSPLATFNYYKSELVSPGIEYECDIFGDLITFNTNLITNYATFDHQHLLLRLYLDLRYASVSSV